MASSQPTHTLNRATLPEALHSSPIRLAPTRRPVDITPPHMRAVSPARYASTANMHMHRSQLPSHRQAPQPHPPAGQEAPVLPVYEIRCATCSLYFSNRAMKAMLLFRQDISLFSCDALPVGCSSPPGSMMPTQVDPNRACGCLTQTLCCHGCGNVVGYAIIAPCIRCSAPSFTPHCHSNGHRFVFHQHTIAANLRRYVKGETGVLPHHPVPHLPHPLQPSNQPSEAIQSNRTAVNAVSNRVLPPHESPRRTPLPPHPHGHSRRRRPLFDDDASFWDSMTTTDWENVAAAEDYVTVQQAFGGRYGYQDTIALARVHDTDNSAPIRRFAFSQGEQMDDDDESKASDDSPHASPSSFRIPTSPPRYSSAAHPLNGTNETAIHWVEYSGSPLPSTTDIANFSNLEPRTVSPTSRPLHHHTLSLQDRTTSTNPPSSSHPSMQTRRLLDGDIMYWHNLVRVGDLGGVYLDGFARDREARGLGGKGYDEAGVEWDMERLRRSMRALR